MKVAACCHWSYCSYIIQYMWYAACSYLLYLIKILLLYILYISYETLILQVFLLTFAYIASITNIKKIMLKFLFQASAYIILFFWLYSGENLTKFKGLLW